MVRTIFPVQIVRTRSKHNPKHGAYEPWMVKDAYELVGKLGARHQELALFFDVDITTIENWVKNKPEFARAVKRARVESGLIVSKSLFNKANGCIIKEQVVIQNVVKEYAENGKLLRTHIEPIIVTIEKQLPPDAYAAHKYLTIMHREIWAENSSIDINHNYRGELTIRNVDELSMDELSDDIKTMLFDLNMKQLSKPQHN